MKLILAFVLVLPSILEAYQDRGGENVRDKKFDSLYLLIFAVLASALLWLLLDVQPLKTISLLLGWRLLIFDTLVNRSLKRHSESHKNINIWTYLGTTSRIDKMVSVIDCRLRMAARIILFASSLWWFLSS